MEKPQELIETEKRIEEKEATITLIREATAQLKATQQKIVELTADLNKATDTINHQTSLLKFATEDTQVLLAFIKSNGLKPPGRFAHA